LAGYPKVGALLVDQLQSGYWHVAKASSVFKDYLKNRLLVVARLANDLQNLARCLFAQQGIGECVIIVRRDFRVCHILPFMP